MVKILKTKEIVDQLIVDIEGSGTMEELNESIRKGLRKLDQIV